MSVGRGARTKGISQIPDQRGRLELQQQGEQRLTQLSVETG